MISDSLTIGIIQFRPEWGCVEKNLEMSEGLIASAKEKEAEVVVLPEMWPIGYGDFDFRRFGEPIPGRYTKFLADNARRWQLHIVAGIPEQGLGNEVYNTSVFIDKRGKILARHRKVHLYRSVGEEKIFTPGDKFTVVDTEIGKIGLLICYDGDFPESWRVNAVMGAEIVFQVSAYESPCEEWWDKFYPAAALQNTVWMILSSMVGDTTCEGRSLHFFGRSRIIAPDGEIVAEAPYVAPGQKAESFVLVKRIDLKMRFEEARKKLGNFLRDRRPELYGAIAE